MPHYGLLVLLLDFLISWPCYSSLFQLLEPYGMEGSDQLPAVYLCITYQILKALEHEGMERWFLSIYDSQESTDNEEDGDYFIFS